MNKKLSRLYFSLLDIGVGIHATEKSKQQHRLINQMTLTLMVIGAPFVSYFWMTGTYYHASVLSAGVIMSSFILFISWRFQNGNLSAHLLLSMLCIVFSVTNLRTGGFNYPHFSWTYIIPVVAGLLLGRGGMFLYLVIQTGITLAFYFAWQAGVALPNMIPVEHQATMAVLNRITVVATLSFIVLGFVLEREKIEKELVKAKSEAEAGSKATSEFLATMSHEIRTPLNGVLGMAELMNTTQLNQDQARFLNSIRSSSRSLLAVLNDVLDYSKIEAGRMDIEKTKFNFAQLVSEAVSLFALRSAESGIELIVYIDPLLPVDAIGDSTRIKQVIINLLGNAFKFTEKGEIQLIVTGEANELGSLIVKFEVIDSGIGISPEKQLHLFDSFSQADASTTRKYGGSGLGLAICRRLVRLMDGEVGVDSAEGMGSTFWFTVSVGALNSSELNEYRSAVAGMQIIIADSCSTRSKLLQKSLPYFDVNADNVRTFEGIKTKLQSQKEQKKYDAVLMDTRFSGGSGPRLLNELASDKSALSSKFILLDDLTALQLSRDKDLQHIDFVIEKPLLINDLLPLLSIKLNKENVFQRTNLAEGSSFPGFKVLIVEDNEVNQAVIEGILEVLHVGFELVENGQEAVDWLIKNPRSCDLVLMDCEMPVMDGIEATKQIRSQPILDRNGKDLPVIALSAHALESKKTESYEAGMNYFLTKPVDVEDIARVITMVSRGEIDLLG
ncbi:MAG: response regulator [Pseudomonadales bacterium]|nr:response regulator [Pseudomonadales bacterium]